MKVLPFVFLGPGLFLMVGKIYADSEPGGIPIIMVVGSIIWLTVRRLRTKQHGS